MGEESLIIAYQNILIQLKLKFLKKKQILFNEKILNKQKNKKIIIVEGYFDVIKLEQSGFSNCLAPLGTSINHEKLIEITKKGIILDMNRIKISLYFSELNKYLIPR